MVCDRWDAAGMVRRYFGVPRPRPASEWADRGLVLDEKTSPEPGPLRLSRTPYMRGPLDAYSDSRVTTITLEWSTQVGKTVTMLAMLGSSIDQDPGTSLYVMPDEGNARKIVGDRIIPLIENSPKLRRHQGALSRDTANLRIDFDRMRLYPAWSNSPSSLASFPCRFVFMDEVDKYPRWSGREADPRKLAEERTKNFWNRKVVIVSTPTTESGTIHQSFLRSDQRRFWVRCPLCGEYQILWLSGICWQEGLSPSQIRTEGSAWYQCASCSGRIFDRDKPGMLETGVWCPEGCTVTRDGVIAGDPANVVPDHAGFHLSVLYSPWVSFGRIAAEHLESREDPALLMNFVNSWLAEPWQEQSERVSYDSILALRADGHQLVFVPDDAVVLTAGIDVQLGRVFAIIRAWGPGDESWLVWNEEIHDQVDQETGEITQSDLGALRDLLLRTWPRVGGGPGLKVRLSCVDTGYRTDEVYKFCRQVENVRPVKGANKELPSPFYPTTIDRDRRGRLLAVGLQLWYVDTKFFKDRINRMRKASPPLWHIPTNVSQDYMKQVSSEHKVILRNSRGIRREVWTLRPGQKQNHYWDGEVYAAAAAEMLGVSRMVKSATSRRTDEPLVVVDSSVKIRTQF